MSTRWDHESKLDNFMFDLILKYREKKYFSSVLIEEEVFEELSFKLKDFIKSLSDKEVEILAEGSDK